jgi:hypothetical protein
VVPEEIMELPNLPRITQLVITAAQPRYVAPSAVTLLASKLPGLEYIQWELSDNERRYPSLRSKLRAEFTRGLASLRTPNIQRFELEYMHETPGNEAFGNANLLGESKSDLFSSRLREYLQAGNLVNINLKGPICLGPDFFLPEGDAEGVSVNWPQLKTLDVEISHVRPDGGWYLKRDPTFEFDSDEEGSDEESLPDDDDDVLSESSLDSEIAFGGSQDSFSGEDERQPQEYDLDRAERRSGDKPCRHFRSFPTPELEQLFRAAACAARRMPQLQRFHVEFSAVFFNYDYFSFDFTFASSGTKSRTMLDEHDLHRNRLIWQIPRGSWQVGMDLETLWNEVLGEDGIVKFEKC